MRQAFERAILEDADDPANYAAYADWLFEQGDPRGEFMQVQLALEDERRPRSERAGLREREAALLAAHQSEWLRPLAPFLLSGERASPATSVANSPSGMSRTTSGASRGVSSTPSTSATCMCRRPALCATHPKRPSSASW
jgi:uncharacterized protein (TIGR02996 family)